MRIPFRESSHDSVNEDLIYAVLDHYDVEIAWGPDAKNWLMCFCPLHLNVNTPALRVNLDTGITHCLSVCGTNSLPRFVAKIEGVSDLEARGILDRLRSKIVQPEAPALVDSVSATTLVWWVQRDITSEILHAEDMLLGRIGRLLREAVAFQHKDTCAYEYTRYYQLEALFADVHIWAGDLLHEVRDKPMGDPRQWRSLMIKAQKGFFNRLKALCTPQIELSVIP